MSAATVRRAQIPRVHGTGSRRTARIAPRTRAPSARQAKVSWNGISPSSASLIQKNPDPQSSASAAMSNGARSGEVVIRPDVVAQPGQVGAQHERVSS